VTSNSYGPKSTAATVFAVVLVVGYTILVGVTVGCNADRGARPTTHKTVDRFVPTGADTVQPAETPEERADRKSRALIEGLRERWNKEVDVTARANPGQLDGYRAFTWADWRRFPEPAGIDVTLAQKEAATGRFAFLLEVFLSQQDHMDWLLANGLTSSFLPGTTTSLEGLASCHGAPGAFGTHSRYCRETLRELHGRMVNAREWREMYLR
jgi:hypothetical protein